MNAQQLRNSILQEAIEGRLVPQDPNDEPASVLLERIREEKKRLVKEGKLKKKDLVETPISEDEKPFEIPESWEWCIFGNVISLLSGRDLTPQEYSENKNGIPYITGASNFDGESLILNRWTSNPVTISKYGDLLITCKGTIGTMAFNLIGDIHIARQVMAISPYIADVRYVKYFLLRIVYELDKKAKSIIPGISREDILNAKIPLPPLAEQKRIVAKIEELLPKVEEYGKAQDALNKLNEELPERLKKSVLQEAIEGRLVPQDPNDEPASVLLNRIREEKKRLVKEGKLKKKDLEETPISEDEIPFEIPESWEWHRIGFLSNLYTGNSISKDVKESKYTNVNGRWYIATKDVGFDNSIDYDNGVYIPEKDEPQFKIASAGSILMCIEGGSAGRKIGIIDRDVCFGNKLCCFSTYGAYNKYLYYYLQSSSFKEIFNDNKKGIIGGVSINMMSPLAIPIPPLAEQKRIVAKIEEVFKEIEKL